MNLTTNPLISMWKVRTTGIRGKSTTDVDDQVRFTKCCAPCHSIWPQHQQKFLSADSAFLSVAKIAL